MDFEVGQGLAACGGQRVDADIRAHLQKQIEETGACRIDPDISQQQALFGCDTAGDEEERGGGKITRHRDAAGPQTLAALDGDGWPIPQHLDPERPEHPLRVITGRSRLGDSRTAGRLQSCKQNGRLHLGARHGQGVVDCTKCLASQELNGRSPLICLNVGAHEPQRRRHPLHWPPHEGFIADQGR